MLFRSEINQLAQQFQVIANSQVGTRYIFSGTLVDIPPMPEAGVWDGNSSEYKIEVGSNLRMGVSIDGRKLFGIDNPEGSLFNTLNKLSEGLNSGDQDMINNALSEVDSHTDGVLALRAELGAKTNRMNVIFEQLDSSIINLKQNLSNLQDADKIGRASCRERLYI